VRPWKKPRRSDLLDKVAATETTKRARRDGWRDRTKWM